ncbi:hypothetical protein SERLA73DRAFT_187874 [Serpula lacrymans var. lacrymans S7.3]|uniref:WD40 repeat-like protein n=1 Tax=Serpula lacrymans var. lacrymans (strain S7.3) TaxID=936435 RepID=F8QAM2_SERL3|nr:hypothetical protein SERLA73DRAFT_187874 [Serpula lacrymans var. lacrymans S7.3]
MSNDLGEYSWVPPQYDVSRPPNLVSTARLDPDPDFPENFIRTAKWSPDGANVLSQCENRSFQFFDLSTESPSTTSSASLNYSRTLHQSSPILDFVWYPSASSRDLASYCFVASVRECPVKLLDASDGRLRASYRIVDHRERQIAPHSLAFNLTAQKLYCGFEDAIEIFDVHRPGEGTRLPTTPSKKTKEGLKGIISSIAFSSSYDTYAAGSLSPSSSFAENIALFSEASNEPVMYVGADIRASVTQLMFNPTKPHMLYAAFRRQSSIYAWDLRGNTSTPLRLSNPSSSNKSGLTNQKIRFDVDLAGRRLGVGGQDGNVSLFDLDIETEADTVYEESVQEVEPSLTYEAHKDAVGSVAFHPLQSVLLSASGSRHFEHDDTGDAFNASGDTSNSESESDDQGHIARKMKRRPHPVVMDASLNVWSFATD